MASGGQTLLNAIVIGGTGATGRCLVGYLLKAKDEVGKVTVLTRRKVEELPEQYGVDLAAEEAGGRLVQHIEDLEAVSEDTVKQLCTGGHVFFNCLGTTRSQAGSAQAFRHIDHEIPARLIQLARDAGIPHCSLLTSSGANPNSWFLYMKTKGQHEEAVKGMKFPYTSIFRPGMLDRPAASRRFGEKLAMAIFRGMPVSTLAQAMVVDAVSYHQKQEETGSEGATAQSPKVMVANNSVIYELCQPKKATTDVTADEPAANEPTGDKPTADEPTADEPTADEPTGDKPTADEPTADEPTADKPTADKPTADEPTADKPTANEPTADEPTADEPTADKPTA